MHGSWIVFLGLILFGVYAWRVRSEILRRRAACIEAWSELEEPLKRRYKLTLLLISTLQPVWPQSQLLEKLADARQKAANCMGSMREMSKVEGELALRLHQVLTMAQNQPSVAGNMTQFCQALDKMHAQLEDATRFYNGSAMAYNTYITEFPANIVAGLFHFEQRGLFEPPVPADESK